ncbi:hypothetical protein DFH08DRAFT_841832 [Mycena albidolilacea]|uniref:Uncharacterized protein n=1 Tax=Mycena albidolilacea TaxID=1033008 RepID=A0AAD7AMH0_9AGAR|nr:hypothetical protein DFH08DRAFT_841832 [Mycena albidolilacea]
MRMGGTHEQAGRTRAGRAHTRVRLDTYIVPSPSLVAHSLGAPHSPLPAFRATNVNTHRGIGAQERLRSLTFAVTVGDCGCEGSRRGDCERKEGGGHVKRQGVCVAASVSPGIHPVESHPSLASHADDKDTQDRGRGKHKGGTRAREAARYLPPPALLLLVVRHTSAPPDPTPHPRLLPPTSRLLFAPPPRPRPRRARPRISDSSKVCQTPLRKKRA